jgi:hypothetical protein
MSSDLKEQAKKIIAKGKILNDPELVRMGLEMLDAYVEESNVVTTVAVASEVKKIITPITTAGKFDMEQFTMSKATSNVIDRSGKRQPIYVGPRQNKYEDDGVEAKDIKTPSVQPTERSRKSIDATKVEQKCEVCGKAEKVLPLYAREFYRCESCLLKGKS